MSFENLSYRYVHTIRRYPEEWLPLLHLYDADLPLFPLQYFHVLPGNIPAGKIPEASDRAFGYFESAHFVDSGLKVTVICSKDLNAKDNSEFLPPIESEIEERLGISNPVMPADVSSTFQPPFDHVNAVLFQIWKRVVSARLRNSLPFGRLFDPIFGLARFASSWYSPSGRKSEWIETYYFSSRFGKKIGLAGDLPKIDFYLLPTFREFADPNSNLSQFPEFKALSSAARAFHKAFCTVENIGGGMMFSKFNPPFTGTLDTEKLMEYCIDRLAQDYQGPLKECFNAFDKGPMRTIMFLQMLNDIRDRRLAPQQLTPAQFGLIYGGKLKGFYQTPKVIALYAQQCFGNPSAFPIDTWVETFMKWPLMIYPSKKKDLQSIFTIAKNLGKVERLLWISAQARKVHSSLCDDALWCTKYDSESKPRGANPLACNACLPAIRHTCPAYRKIANRSISFNTRGGLDMFEIWTSQGNNIDSNQQFKRCIGSDKYGAVHDDFTPMDARDQFAPFPQPGHRGQALTVEEFVNTY